MPLKSLKILDFSTLLPGPFATMMLSDMGAEVLRVEAPGRFDLTRAIEPTDKGGVSYVHQTLNRSKRSIGLNLKSPEAVELIKELIKEYDIVVEQFRPGVMAKFGLDYNSLKDINPKLIYCSITGFGQTGPYKDRAGHDINYMAISGLASYTGTKETGPLPIGVQAADMGGGSMHAIAGILAAVIERSQSGEGQYVDISMTDAAFSLNAMAGASAVGGGLDTGLEDSLLNGGSFYNHYETKDGRYFSVGGLEPAFMKQLCEAIGRPDLIKNGLTHTPEAQVPLIDALTVAFKEHDFAHWHEVFLNLDACVEPTLSVKEAAEHPQILERDMVVELQGEHGLINQIGAPIKFSKHQPKYDFVGCPIGTHNDEVMAELGFDTDKVEELKSKGVFG